MPGHVEIKDNDRENSLASLTTIIDGRVMDQNDILNAIRDTGWKVFLGSKLDNTSWLNYYTRTGR